MILKILIKLFALVQHYKNSFWIKNPPAKAFPPACAQKTTKIGIFQKFNTQEKYQQHLLAYNFTYSIAPQKLAPVSFESP